MKLTLFTHQNLTGKYEPYYHKTHDSKTTTLNSNHTHPFWYESLPPSKITLGGCLTSVHWQPPMTNLPADETNTWGERPCPSEEGIRTVPKEEDALALRAVCSGRALVQKLQKVSHVLFSRWYSSGMTRGKRRAEWGTSSPRVISRMSLSARAPYCYKGAMPFIKKKERKRNSHAKHYIKTYCFVTWTGSSDLKLYMYLSRNVLLGTICDSRVTREG